ncbi:hypothetical protein EVG20_g11448 [Dentipellis fragilis]|uniref:Uncharacterized protein n=1 Tax=Dentipellis fragilis TaxID=205917 RepID=A0A4Y9XPX0_9AGAM|nr:hypothetical protein EVG20_g11448 [Dentipellis fragilis]
MDPRAVRTVADPRTQGPLVTQVLDFNTRDRGRGPVPVPAVPDGRTPTEALLVTEATTVRRPEIYKEPITTRLPYYTAYVRDSPLFAKDHRGMGAMVLDGERLYGLTEHSTTAPGLPFAAAAALLLSLIKGCAPAEAVLVDEPTSVDCPQVFRDTVETRLPYYAAYVRDSESLLKKKDCPGAMMLDGERLYRLEELLSRSGYVPGGPWITIQSILMCFRSRRVAMDTSRGSTEVLLGKFLYGP